MSTTSEPPSLRAEQVAQTRGALVAAGRSLFGEKGFRGTSVEDLAREARLTTGALYHHFPTKTALFEAVFVEAHMELMAAALDAAKGAKDGLDELAVGFDAFLDGVLQPDVQRILVLDGPAVLGLARYTELDEKYAHAVDRALADGGGEVRRDGDRRPGDFDAAAAGCADQRRDADRERRRPGADTTCGGQVDAGTAEQLHTLMRPARRTAVLARPTLMRGCWVK